MPLYAGELNVRRGAPLAEYPAPLSEVLHAQSEETQLHNPLQSLKRLREMEDATQGEVIPSESTFDAATQITRAPVTRLDAETARTRVKESGLSLTIPDDGISERALGILMKAKRDEMRRQDIFARGPSDVGAGAARLSVALVESLFDPLNIASAFIPVVGPARYAAMLKSAASPLARAAVRAEVGALEGAVGAAVLEPLIYSAAQAEQLDYTMYDSLANVAFGGLFGGGLHVAGGAVADAVRAPRIAAERRLREELDKVNADAKQRADAAVQSADIQSRLETQQQQNAVDTIRQAQGLPPQTRASTDAAQVLDAFETARKQIAEINDKPAFQRTAAENVLLKVSDDLEALAPELRAIAETPAMRRAVEIAKKEPFLRSAEERIFLRAMQEGYEPKLLNERTGEIAREMAGLQSRRTPDNAAEIEAAQAALNAEQAAITQRLKDLGVDTSAADLVAARVAPATRRLAHNMAVVQAAQGRGVNVDAILRLDPAARQEVPGGEEVRAAAQRDSVLSADPEASRAASEAQPKPHDVATAEEELAESLTVAQDYAQALGEPDRVAADLKPFDEALKRADLYAKALKAGAACGIG